MSSWLSSGSRNPLLFGMSLVMVGLVAEGAGAFPTVDLATDLSDIVVYGAEVEDFLSCHHCGFAVADLNGDGEGDLVVTAPLADGPGNARPVSGEAYVFFGPFTSGTTLDLLSTAPDVIIYGADAGDSLGWGAWSDDLSGDGIDDLVLGAYRADGPSENRDDAGFSIGA